MIQEDKDVMSKIVLVIAVLVLLAVVIFLIARLASKVHTAEADMDNPQVVAAIEARIRPVGQVDAGPVSSGPVVRSGKQIYEGVCSSCHATGLLNSPKFGNKADWAPRIAKGIPTLIKHATEGFNMMPAKGGDATLTPEDIDKVVHYLVNAAK